MASINLGPSQSHIPVIRKFGLKPRKPHLKLAQPKLAKLSFNNVKQPKTLPII